jgi:hypothetical protein
MATPGPTPLPTPLPTQAEAAPTPAPIPLTHKKVSSGEIRAASGELSSVSGDIPPVKRRPTPDGFADLALGPTVQVKVDADGTPLELPAAPRDLGTPAPAPRANHTPAPAPVAAPVVRRKTPTPSPALDPPVRAGKTPPPSRLTPAAAFNAVEADFFAREADLYKRETVDTFDDLDSGGGRDSRSPSSKSRRRRK